MDYQKVFLELKNLSVFTRGLLIAVAIVTIAIGGACGYLFAQEHLSSKSKSLTQNNSLNSRNYQLSLTKLENKSITGKVGTGVKVTYLGKELIEGDLKLEPKKNAQEINFRIGVGNEILNLILPLSEIKVVSSGSQAKTSGAKSTGKYVASKSGSKYHLATCRYATGMKEENKVYYNSKEEAEADGKEPCGVCKP